MLAEQRVAGRPKVVNRSVIDNTRPTTDYDPMTSHYTGRSTGALEYEDSFTSTFNSLRDNTDSHNSVNQHFQKIEDMDTSSKQGSSECEMFLN